jgi:hypothetical protein
MSSRRRVSVVDRTYFKSRRRRVKKDGKRTETLSEKKVPGREGKSGIFAKS